MRVVSAVSPENTSTGSEVTPLPYSTRFCRLVSPENRFPGSAPSWFPVKVMYVTAVRPAKSPAFSDVMLLLSRISSGTDARLATVTASQALTVERRFRISSCTSCVRSQMPVVWASAVAGRARPPKSASSAAAASARAERTRPRRAPARRAKPAGRAAADAVFEEGEPPRRGGRRSGGDGGSACSRARGAVMASALGARRSALGARRSALGARRSALGARRSALGARRSALGALNCNSYTRKTSFQPLRTIRTHRRVTPGSRPVNSVASDESNPNRL